MRRAGRGGPRAAENHDLSSEALVHDIQAAPVYLPASMEQLRKVTSPSIATPLAVLTETIVDDTHAFRPCCDATRPGRVRLCTRAGSATRATARVSVR